MVGNQITRSDADCAHASGYHDQRNQWHATIRREEGGMRSGDGRLAPQDEARLQARLDNLSTTVRQSVNGQGF